MVQPDDLLEKVEQADSQNEDNYAENEDQEEEEEQSESDYSASKSRKKSTNKRKRTSSYAPKKSNNKKKKTTTRKSTSIPTRRRRNQKHFDAGLFLFHFFGLHGFIFFRKSMLPLFVDNIQTSIGKTIIGTTQFIPSTVNTSSNLFPSKSNATLFNLD